MNRSLIISIIAVIVLLAAPSIVLSQPYDHVYCTGEFKPDSAISLHVKGSPGSSPVLLFLGLGLSNSPVYHVSGIFYLELPLSLIMVLGSIPGNGTLSLSGDVPASPVLLDVYMQAYIEDRLTNPYVLEVREIAPAGMVLVPGGEFEMGDHHGIGDPEELPVHAVYVDTFFMDVREITNRQYCDYLNSAMSQALIEVSTGKVHTIGNTYELYCNTYTYSWYSRIHWDGVIFTVTSGKEFHPMNEVSWFGAAAYANWRSTEAGLNPCYDLSNLVWECDFDANGYRLPTEAEWEYAARGNEQSPYYIYPWGDTLDGTKANYSDSGDDFEGTWPETTPVSYYNGFQPMGGTDMANGFGLYDMTGNVWEWVHDWYDPNYYATSPYDNPTGPALAYNRVLRGASWYDWDADSLRSSRRRYHGENHLSPTYGFRLVRK